ncbi:MAG: hypothetical protein DRJ11_03325 [Candidatus Aminicenantes bacterium]|nr:MAG: hypothetical protein DRJ11_03325 [Candidatus Aminicenantes bacterium]
MLLFKGISGKKIEADFNGGEIRSNARVLFLREVGEKSIFIRENHHNYAENTTLRTALKSNPLMCLPFLVVLESIFFLFFNL